MAGKRPDEDETYWVLREDQLRCLASAARTDIVDHLAGRGPLSIRELARAIGKQPSALYHHLDKLLAVDLVVEAGARVVNRKQEKLYATPSRRMRLRRALESDEHREVMREIVGSLTRQAERDFARGQEQAGATAGGKVRNLGFFRLVARPRPESLTRINELLDEIAELMWQEEAIPGESEEGVVALTWVMAPGE